MKMNTLEKLLDSLRNDCVEVTVDGDIKSKAQAAIQRMLTVH
jgi:quinolinate synthase